MADRGSDLYDYEGRIFEWKRCEVPGCENNVCIGLSDKFCYPHTSGNKHVKRMKLDAVLNTDDADKRELDANNERSADELASVK